MLYLTEYNSSLAITYHNWFLRLFKMSMKAVCYKGPFSVEVQDVAIPSIEHPDDIIVKVTTSAICGSDLHMYEGRTGAEPGEY